MNEIIKKIKELKSIEPENVFAKHSLRLILSNQQNSNIGYELTGKFFDLIKMSFTLGLTSLVIIGFFGAISLIKTLSPASLTSLDNTVLNQEINSLDASINLSEVKYYDNSISKISMALNETSKTAPDHLNATIIEKEMNNLDKIKSDNKTIDDLLNEIML